jgi:hypothetical protein
VDSNHAYCTESPAESLTLASKEESVEGAGVLERRAPVGVVAPSSIDMSALLAEVKTLPVLPPLPP